MRPTAGAGVWKLAAFHRDLAALARRPTRPRAREARVRFVRGLIACLAFLGLLWGAWMIGTQPIVAAFINASRDRVPPKPSNAAAGTKRDVIGIRRIDGPHGGLVVYELDDGFTCQFMAFNNVTGWTGETSTGLCESVLRKQGTGNWRDFSWGR